MLDRARTSSSPRRPRRLAFAALAAPMTLAMAAGCSSTPNNASGGASSGTGSAAITWSPAGTFGTKPTVVVPQGNPPSTLQTHDLIVGSGATADPGAVITVQYVGYSWTTRQEFDASWDRGQSFSFPLGAHQVIPGWDQGVAGMKVGGRRELVIPPSLGYGAQSPGPGITKNDTLIFVVDLVKVG